MQQNKKGLLGFLMNPTFWIIAVIVFFIYFGFVRTGAMTADEAFTSMSCVPGGYRYVESISNTNAGDVRAGYLFTNWIAEAEKAGYSDCKLYGGNSYGGILSNEGGKSFVACCNGGITNTQTCPNGIGTYPSCTCSVQFSKKCASDGNVHWYDSCNNMGDIAFHCSTDEVCRGDSCILASSAPPVSSSGETGTATTTSSQSFLDKITTFVHGIINKFLGVFGIRR